MTGDPFDLQRFVDAQEGGGAYSDALAELRDGRKRGHWIWFVFPQIAGLGQSPTSRLYAIGSPAQGPPPPPPPPPAPPSPPRCSVRACRSPPPHSSPSTPPSRPSASSAASTQ